MDQTVPNAITNLSKLVKEAEVAHMVLEELYDWAEQNNQEVKELIEKIETDMAWNEE